jgi:molybdenum cofactor biosynthesis protein B
MKMAHGGGDREFMPLNIAVLTVSDSRTEADDKSGKTLVERLTAAGHQLAEKAIEPDDRYRIRATLSRWIADPDVQAVITTGGTGLTGRDGTPEAVEPLLDKVVEGFGELFRTLSYQDIGSPTAPSSSACPAPPAPAATAGTRSSSTSSTPAPGHATWSRSCPASSSAELLFQFVALPRGPLQSGIHPRRDT